MSFTIDDLCHSSCYRRRTTHAAPARSHHTGLGPVCTTLFTPGLTPCPDLAPGRDAGSCSPHRDGRLAGDGAELQTPLHQLPSRLEPGHVAGTLGWPNRVGTPRRLPGAPWGAHCAGSRRHCGTPQWPQDHGSRLPSRCRALHQEACHPLLWLEVGVDDAVGSGALGQARMGVALSHRAVLAGPEERSPTAPNQRGLGPADDAASAALAPRAATGVGRRWRLCRHVVGAGLCEAPGGHGLAFAVGCGALSPAGARPPGKCGPTPLKGKRQRSLQAWAERSDTPWETVAVDWYGGQRKTLWVFSRTALWYTLRLPPVDIRYVLVGDPEGKLRMEVFFCTDVQATPVEILPWIVMLWSVEVTFEEARVHLGFENQRQWSDKAITRTSPVLLALYSRVTLLGLRLSQGGQIPVPVTTWYHKAEPTFADCLALVRQHLWRAQDGVNSTAEPDFGQFTREVFERLLTGLPLAA